MRVALIGTGLALVFSLGGCDQKEPDLGIPKTRDMTELKQSKDTKMSKEELEAARREAGFKSHEEQVAEAKEAYDKMEKGYVKGRVDQYREMLDALGKKLDAIEKAAAKWTKAKDAAGAFAKFEEKYKEEKKEFIDAYMELTEERSRGGNFQVEVDKAVTGWEELVGALGPDTTEEDVKSATEEIRKQITVVSEELDAIEKDESIEADEVEAEGEGKKKKK